MKKSQKKSVLKQSQQKKQELTRKKLYKILTTICGFLNYKDLFILKEKEFADLCDVRQVGWNLKFNSFVDPSILKENQSVTTKFPLHYHLSLPLEYEDWSAGNLIFTSDRKLSSAKKKVLKQIADAVAVAVYFMEERVKLESLKLQWNVAFDSFHRALCIADENFKVIRANQSFSQLVGSSKKELFGRAVFDFLCVSEEEIKATDFSFFHTMNQKRFEIRSSPLCLEEDRFILLMVSDITEESLLQEKLSLKARETELGFIRGSIAHELNNPLAGMKTLLHIMETNEEMGKISDSHSREIREEIKSAVERCERIVKTVLKASREPLVSLQEKT